MSTDVAQLAIRLDAALRRGGANPRPWLWRPLLHLLARGEPVTVGELAAATGRTVGEVHSALAGLPDTEFDEHGRIVGHGITLRPTPHRFEIDGRLLYTWCALDTLIFPAVLDRPATVTSPCHATGTTIRLHVAPDRVIAAEPTTAVVSVVTPTDCTSIRAAFCNQVHFFASPAAASWLRQHPDAAVLPIAEAVKLSGPLTDILLTDDTECC